MGRPEVAVAIRVSGVENPMVPGLGKVMVWVAWVMTVFDGFEDGPVPAELVAVTRKVYGVPLVRPVMVMGEPVPVAVMPPGTEVTV